MNDSISVSIPLEPGAGSLAEPVSPGRDEAAETLLAVLSASPDCIKLLDSEGRITFGSPNCREALDLDAASEMVGRHWWVLWPQEAREPLQHAVLQAVEGKASRVSARRSTRAKLDTWWDVSIAPIAGNADGPHRILVISRDVTELVLRHSSMEHDARLQEAMIEQQRLLMREVDHRVKNSLTMIASLLRMQVRATPDSAAQLALTEAANRVLTVGRVHDRLYHSATTGVVPLPEFLEPLCAEIADAMAPGRVQITAKVAPVTLPAERAIALGLLTAELVTNALRHGLNARAEGGELRLLLSEDGSEIEMSVVDNGLGLPEGFNPSQPTGLGMRVVQSMVSQLDGELSHSRPNEGGTRFTVRFSSS